MVETICFERWKTVKNVDGWGQKSTSHVCLRVPNHEGLHRCAHEEKN